MTGDIRLEDNLIRGCQEGEESAQYRVYKNYVKAMYNIAVRITGNPQDAEEVIQDAFLTVFLKIRDFRRETSLGVWIRRIVINRCIDHIRKRKPMYDLMMDIPDVPEEEEPVSVDPAKVHRMIMQLPDGARTILSLFLLEGFRHREIADMLQISESTSKTQYHRARQLLIRKLKESDHELNREI